MLLVFQVVVALSAVPCLASTIPAANGQSPIVNLGYARHMGLYNDTQHLYTFKNIRFADAPTGHERFNPAKPASRENNGVNDGSVGFKCPQAFPEWYLSSSAKTLNITTEQLSENLLKDPTMSEDCLFLDVFVPKGIFEKKHKNKRTDKSCATKKPAPVMVWIYGGGYTFGQKDGSSYNPTGLIAQSQLGNSEGIVYVAINYRLGLFGWLNGLGDHKLFPNVGLQDQRLGLQWVQKYIHLFGGDPKRVTVFGESAGGGSIMHQITGEGGKKKAPFKRAIIQSPGWLPSLPVAQIFNDTLAAASKRAGRPIRNGSDLAKLDSKTLMQVNSDIVFKSEFGFFTYGPTVDGGFVPNYPGVSLLKGHFDSSVDLLVGHNSHESDVFTPATINSNEKLVKRLRSSIYGIKDSAIKYILSDLYPPVSGTTPYKSELARATLIASEYTFVCNTRYLATSVANRTHNYRFQVPPGYHATDIPYTFFNGNATGVVSGLATQMQAYFTQFAATGNPNAATSPVHWPEYGSDAQIATFDTNGVGTAVDDGKNKRCEYWQKGTYTK